MLKTFLLKTFLPVFAFIADFVTIVSVLQSDNLTIKSMWENPYVNVLFLTLSLTALVFLAKYLYTRFTKKKKNLSIDEKEGLELSSFLWIAMIILCGVILAFAFRKPKEGALVKEAKTDTVYKDRLVLDTVYSTLAKSNGKSLGERAASKPKVRDTTKEASKFSIPNATFNAPAQIGDNNTQNNGIIPRKITENDIMPFMNAYFPDRKINIYFQAFDGVDAEMTTVKNKIIDILRKNGYSNIETSFHLAIGFKEPEKIMIDSIRGQNMLSIQIPHAKPNN